MRALGRVSALDLRKEMVVHQSRYVDSLLLAVVLNTTPYGWDVCIQHVLICVCEIMRTLPLGQPRTRKAKKGFRQQQHHQDNNSYTLRMTHYTCHSPPPHALENICPP